MPQERKNRKTLDHTIPFWVTNHTLNKTFFITICCKQRHHNQLAKPEIWSGLLETISTRNERNLWTCHLALVMPDHFHGLFSFEGKKSMSSLIKDWKRWTAKRLKINWQDGLFDHRLRSNESLVEKRQYIFNNPVRAGLISDSGDWPYLWERNESSES